ncbi:MAG: hypothetical protein U0807_13550 [Candidatus Binatia bacterium]
MPRPATTAASVPSPPITPKALAGCPATLARMKNPTASPLASGARAQPPSVTAATAASNATGSSAQSAHGSARASAAHAAATDHAQARRAATSAAAAPRAPNASVSVSSPTSASAAPAGAERGAGAAGEETQHGTAGGPDARLIVAEAVAQCEGGTAHRLGVRVGREVPDHHRRASVEAGEIAAEVRVGLDAAPERRDRVGRLRDLAHEVGGLEAAVGDAQVAEVGRREAHDVGRDHARDREDLAGERAHARQHGWRPDRALAGLEHPDHRVLQAELRGDLAVEPDGGIVRRDERDLGRGGREPRSDRHDGARRARERRQCHEHAVRPPRPGRRHLSGRSGRAHRG